MCRVRVSGGHRPEATAPTEAAAETQASSTVRGHSNGMMWASSPTHTLLTYVGDDAHIVPYYALKTPRKTFLPFAGFVVVGLFLCAVELNELFEVSAASLCGLGGLVEELFGAVGEGACE